MSKDTYIKNDENIEIGRNIRRIRLIKGIKGSNLIREVNLLGADLNTFSLSKIEANRQHIKATQFKAIVRVLKCDPMDLLEESRDEKDT